MEVGGIYSGSVFSAKKKLEGFDGMETRRTIRLSMEALGPALIRIGYMEENDVQAICDELKRVEQDQDILFMSNPVVTVWAKRS
jgi:hypothetical protein